MSDILKHRKTVSNQRKELCYDQTTQIIYVEIQLNTVMKWNTTQVGFFFSNSSWVDFIIYVPSKTRSERKPEKSRTKIGAPNI